MAGFRDFQTGEVLTAANVNDFLAKQSVMKFADATARDTALGTATGGSNALREGMVAYLDDTDAVQVYDGSSWAAVGSDPNAGIGSNIVQTVKTDAFSTSSTSFTPITGLTVTITPTSASSDIFILVTGIATNSTTNQSAFFNLQRDGSNIAQSTGAGVADQTYVIRPGSGIAGIGMAFSFIDSPATTSATTYSVEVRGNGGNARIGRSGTEDSRAITTITAIEVAS